MKRNTDFSGVFYIIMITLRPYQQRIIDATLKALAQESKKGSRHVGVYAPCGGGNALGKGTEILMFDGTKEKK